jgi:hypothetical protein
MFPLVGGLLSGVASLAGSIFSSQTSAQNTQQQIMAQEAMQAQSEGFNAEQADLARQFNAEQAQDTRNFQETMFGYSSDLANTAYQRAAKDMRAAGLNPILAAGQSSPMVAPPSGATASGPAASVGTPSVPMSQKTSPLAGLGAAVNQAVNTAISAKTFDKMTEEIANTQSDTALRDAETRVMRQREATEIAETRKREAESYSAQSGERVSRRAAEAADIWSSAPNWLKQMGVLGPEVSKGISPVSDLISSAMGARRLFMPSEGFRYGTKDGPSGASSFEERFGAAFH